METIKGCRSIGASSKGDAHSFIHHSLTDNLQCSKADILKMTKTFLTLKGRYQLVRHQDFSKM